MSSSTPAIVTTDLSKRFRLGERAPYRRLGEAIARVARAPFHRPAKPKATDQIWALKDINLTVDEGEIVGVVGANGAGKSTLLKILAKITLPTSGRAVIHGRVGSLLEVGTGFHSELTGHENVFLNGSILGMTRREILAKYDEIVDFAQIPEFMDTPVKHYSSGMRVRLAFSVAAHLDPEILFIDEVLSVGDAEFQAKCLGKMEEVAGAGRTILFVSHNMGAVSSLCTRCVWLEHGQTKMDGDPREVVESYLSRGGVGSGKWVRPQAEPAGDRVQIESIEVLGVEESAEGGIPFPDPIRISITHRVTESVRGMWVRAHVLDMSGTVVLTTSNSDDDPESERWEPGLYRQSFEIPGGLLHPGRYMVGARAKQKNTVLDKHEHALTFDVLPVGAPREGGVITPILHWKREQVDD